MEATAERRQIREPNVPMVKLAEVQKPDDDDDERTASSSESRGTLQTLRTVV